MKFFVFLFLILLPFYGHSNKVNILVMGFGPFSGYAYNPGWEVAQRLQNFNSKQSTVKFFSIPIAVPVDEFAANTMWEYLEVFKEKEQIIPDIILLLARHNGSKIRIETQAFLYPQLTPLNELPSEQNHQVTSVPFNFPNEEFFCSFDKYKKVEVSGHILPSICNSAAYNFQSLLHEENIGSYFSMIHLPPWNPKKERKNQQLVDSIFAALYKLVQKLSENNKKFNKLDVYKEMGSHQPKCIKKFHEKLKYSKKTKNNLVKDDYYIELKPSLSPIFSTF